MHNSVTKALFDMFSREEKGDFYPAYLYLKHLDHFMYHALKVSGNPTEKPEGEVGEDVEEMLEAAVQNIAETAGSRETSNYHAKVVKLKDAIQLVSQKKNIALEPPETVIPYKQARNIILQNPDSIALGECACRGAATTSCLPDDQLDVCLFVGDPLATFLDESNPKFRKASQEEAAELLEDMHRKGFVHCAFFKKDLGRRFTAICNCCSCCCQGMKAWNVFGGAIPILAPSGYLARVGDDCTDCGVCEEVCHFDAIFRDEETERYAVDKEKCMGCGVCEGACLVEAISLEREPSKGDPLDLAELLAQNT